MHLVGGESEVKRKRKSLHREEKFCCFFIYILLLSAQRKVLISDWILGPL